MRWFLLFQSLWMLVNCVLSTDDAQSIPRLRRCGLSWIWVDGNLPPLTNRTFIPSKITDIPVIIMVKMTNFMALFQKSDANIVNKGIFLALCKIYFVT